MRYVFHVPVLLEEILQCLQCRSDSVYVDCTCGTGGHSERILSKIAPNGRLIGIDIDAESLAIAKKRLLKFGSRFITVHGDFKKLPEILDSLQVKRVDGILADFGLSTFQLSDSSRGFSFQKEGPLDMRFNRNTGVPAQTIINKLSEKEIKNLLKQYGEEKHYKSISRQIIKRRQKKRIEKTADLSEIAVKVYGKSRWRIHPATKTFQCFRIAVNEELKGLDTFLEQAVERLKKGRRLAVLSYHSLEDRIVKQTFKKLSSRCTCPPSLPICKCEKKEVVRILTSHPIKPSKDEMLRNPRSRSARMRIVEKL